MARNAKLNYFDLTHDVKTTMNMGLLVPVGNFETLPGDWYKIHHEFLLRFMPTLAPVMHIFRISIHAWYVPYRILMEQGDWYKFLTGGEKDGTEGDAVVLPTVTSPKGGWPVGSLADHLQYTTTASGKKESAFALRAYALIYNEMYRNQAVQDPVALSLAQGEDIVTNTNLLRRCWQRDRFTNALPSVSKGPNVLMPMGDSAPVIGNGMSLGLDNGTNKFGIFQYASETLDNAVIGDQALYGKDVGTASVGTMNTRKSVGIGVTTDKEKSGLIADLANAKAPTLNEFRLAATIMQFQELNMRGGSRPVEFIWNHYGVRVPDATLQRPLFLGGLNSNVVISEVLQTSQTTEGESGSPQGTMAGHGVGAGSSPEYRFHCTEHGMIMFLMSVMPNTAYFQGSPRMYNKTTRYEFGLPLLQHIGEQPVRREEVYATGTDSDKEPFAYNRNYYEYTSIPSHVSGDMKTSLKFWHAAREFDSQPVFNEDFILCNPTNRIWAVEDNTDHLVCQVMNHIDSLRPLSKSGRPGIHII